MNVARIRMPRMGSGVHEGTVVEWKKSVGDAVSKGEVLLAPKARKSTSRSRVPPTECSPKF